MVSLKHPKQLTRQTLQIYITECCVSIPQQTSFIISPHKKKHTEQTTSHRKLATETSLTTSSSTCRWSWHFVSRLRCTNSHTTTTPWADYPLALSTESRNHYFIISLIGFREFQGSNPKKSRIEDCNLLSHIKIMRKSRATAMYFKLIDQNVSVSVFWGVSSRSVTTWFAWVPESLSDLCF